MSQTVEPDLDGTTNVLLAPVRGTDERRKLPKSMFVKRPSVFTAKFVVAVVAVAAAWTAVALEPVWWVIAVTVVVNGLMYAHLVELQHECLHEHAYNRRSLNRLMGFLAGVPMLTSYWHYKHDHLRHHAYLGTPQNQEFFNYRFQGLGSLPGFLRGAYHLGRYNDVARDTGRSLLGRTDPGITKTLAAKKIRTEYQLFAVLFAAAVVYSVAARDLYLVWVWVLPTLLVAEPTHFLIEMPEHYGLNTQTDPDVLSNTRTIEAGRFAKWFTNGNDVHTAHHFHQGVPMVNVRALHRVIEDRVETVAPSYWSFYRDVFTGRITYQDNSENCMTR
ncbi:fatty acid desaturase family protein [Streptomyces hokutonensis]|uniref:fatty acid desaturase family protein n=1 Tax=Streptomyces hokutonensis TaxID=1306990 RepID=UPI00035C32AD|nr:fatty acid desaturase [Streptomyces hokutonensis]